MGRVRSVQFQTVLLALVDAATPFAIPAIGGIVQPELPVRGDCSAAGNPSKVAYMWL